MSKKSQGKIMAAAEFGVSSEMPVIQRAFSPLKKMKLITTLAWMNPGTGLSTRVDKRGVQIWEQTFCDAPPLWWSVPGVGKSTAIYEIAKKLGFAIIKIDASEGYTLSVIQVPDRLESGTMVLIRPSDRKIAQVLEAVDRYVLFIDELTDMPLAVQVMIMKLLQTGEIGSDQGKAGGRRVGACNTPRRPGNLSSGTNPTPIKSAASGRVQHFLLSGAGPAPATNHRLSVFNRRYGARAAAAVAAPPNIEALEKLVLEKYIEQFADVHGLFTGFSEMYPDCLDAQIPTENGPQRQERTLNAAADILTTIEAFAEIEGVRGKSFNDFDEAQLASMDEDTRALLEGEDEDGFDLRYMMIAGNVGTSMARDIMTYRSQHKDLPRVADLVSGKVTWQPDTARADRTLLVLEKWTVTLEQMSQPTPTQVGTYIGFLGKIFDTYADFGAAYVDRGVNQSQLLAKDDPRMGDFWDKKEQVSRAARTAKRAMRAIPK